MSRKVKLFSGDLSRNRTHTTPAEQLQAFYDRCEADKDNEYDISDPIVFNGIYLVTYNVEPAPAPPSRTQCAACGQDMAE